jgi:hypothetical protein
LEIVELLGLGGLADILQALESEWVLTVEQILPRLFVKALGVRPVDSGNVDRQRTIHEEGDVGDALFVDELGLFSGIPPRPSQSQTYKRRTGIPARR